MGIRARFAVALFFCASCSFIDDFDFEIADGSAPAEDGGPIDAGDVDGGPELDGGPVGTCTDPCLGDAVLDFDGTQGAGALGWRYLNDTRDPLGLAYGELASGTHDGAPAWTDGTPPPAIVACGSSTMGGCAPAEGQLLFEANAPGDGSDPVLTFVAPADGTYVVAADVLDVDGIPLLTVSRNARHDTIVDRRVEDRGAVTAVIDLFAGERGLIRVAPGADPGGAVALASGVRVSRMAGATPLADCQLAMRFDETDPFDVGCTSSVLTEDGTVDTAITDGPSDEYGSARTFQTDAALRLSGLRNDYSGDFTVQMWVRVDSLNFFSTAFYADWSAFDPATAGGVSFGLDPRSEDDTLEDIVTAGYLFPLPDSGDPGEPSVTCDEDSCSGAIVAQIPSFNEWHFYRMTRVAADDEVRLCIDGELVGTGWLDGTTDISAPADPKLGTYGFRDPTFNGAIDDVRVFTRALPCGE